MLHSNALAIVMLHLMDNVRNTVKPVLSGHSKINKTKILMANCRLMKFESIAE